ncbi:MAG: leucine-rich repeat domain-containing protein [Bacteroidales bacterium]|nr:leucine-rich repeat domain-containing protein [Bacteroidales bacterium]
MKKIFLCLLAMIAAWTAMGQGYYDENHEWNIVPETAIEITDATTELNDGFYYTNYTTINLSSLNIKGNVKLSICNYSSLIISGDINISEGNSLTIYDDDGEGLTASDIVVNGSLHVVWGNITANTIGSTNATISISGGKINATSIIAKSLTLGWTYDYDYINAKINASSITIADGQVFIIDEKEYSGTLTDQQRAAFTSGELPLTPPEVPLDASYLPKVKENLLYEGKPIEPLIIDNDGIIPNGKLWFTVSDSPYNPEKHYDWGDDPPIIREPGTYFILYKVESTNPKYIDRYMHENDQDLKVTIESLGTFQDENFEYIILSKTNKEVELRGYKSDVFINETLTIPSTTINEGNTYTITRIGDFAFNNSDTKLQRVVFREGNSITSIGEHAFANNTKLESINLEVCHKLTDLEDDVLYYCLNLQEITIPQGVTVIPESAFAICTNLKTVTFLGDITRIENNAFYECSLSHIEIPATVKYIGNWAFYDQQNIEDFNITCYAPVSPSFEAPFGYLELEKYGTLTIPEKCAIGYEKWIEEFKANNGEVIGHNVTVNPAINEYKGWDGTPDFFIKDDVKIDDNYSVNILSAKAVVIKEEEDDLPTFEPISDIGNDYILQISVILKNNGEKCFTDPYTVPIEGDYKPKCNITENIVINNIRQDPIDTLKYCNNDSGIITLSFETVSEAKPSKYSIQFENEAIETINNADIPENNKIKITIPSNLAPGIYQGKLTVSNGKITSKKYDVAIEIPLVRNIIKQLYTNVIFVDNHDSIFVGYQWLKNGKEINNETRQYFTEKVLDGSYSVQLTTKNYISIRSCKVDFTPTTKLSPTVTPYPNPAKAGVPFNLKLIGGVPDNASIMIFNNAGAQVQNIHNVTENTTITLPRGYYSGALIYDGQKAGFKIIVE